MLLQGPPWVYVRAVPCVASSLRCVPVVSAFQIWWFQ
uniref:Uncharacterized protein n=1 Tax=Fagus sylvatica TaxID=28930 RepID=A0A2N9J3L8_FAGSY